MSSLIRCKAVWAAMMLDEVFCESMDGGPAEALLAGKSNTDPQYTPLSAGTLSYPSYGGRGPT